MRLTDSAHHQKRFESWVADAKSSDDVRNRVAVVGDAISRGSFGNFYLLATNDCRATPSDQAILNMQSVAANDVEFEPLANKSRGYCK